MFARTTSRASHVANMCFVSPSSRVASLHSTTRLAGGAAGDNDVVADSAAQEGDVLPVNIYENGKDPVVAADDQYPDWLEDIYEEVRLGKIAKREFSMQDKRFWQQSNKRDIKRLNSLRSKK